MRIVLYSTRSDLFNGEYVRLSYYPRRAKAWDQAAALYPEHEIVVVAKKPGNGLFDMDGNEVSDFPENVKYVFIEEGMGMGDIVDLIYHLVPAAAIAISMAGSSFDWNPIMDSMIAQELEKKGVRTVAHRIFTSVASFDKWRSNLMLRSGEFNVAKAMYVHNEMFWVEKKTPSLSANVYKEYVLYRIREMEYPVIIKGTTGAGSVGIQIADNYETARDILLSDGNNADLIVEEMLQGEQFGTEIHGADGKYHVLPPFAFSTNEQGITDPYTGVKFGPVMSEHYHVHELQEALRRMAEQFHFAGVTQVDLVFRNDKWYVIEINPRWSGMTTTAAAAEGRNPWSIFLECALGSSVDYSEWENLKYAMNFKVPEMTEEQMQEMYACPGVQYIGKTVSDHPGRDKVVFCEVVFGGFEDREAMKKAFMELRERFPQFVSDGAVKNLEKLYEKY